MRIITIDGPSGAGKSTLAEAVATRLGVARLDTGAMYRALALAALRTGVDPDDGAALAKLARDVKIDPGPPLTLDGEDASREIRGQAVTDIVSGVSAVPAVRQEMIRRQRQWALDHDGGVVEGRDIGTVVFPEADLKVFLTASGTERARRRARDMGTADTAAIAGNLARRDHLDSTREASPLVVPDGAVVLDTTVRSIEELVAAVVDKL